MAALRVFLLAAVCIFGAASAELFGAQPDGGLYITPDVLNNCKSLPGTAADGSGNAMLLTATGSVTDIKEEGTDLGDCCPLPYKGTPAKFTPDSSKPLNVRRSWLEVQNDPVYMAKLAKGFQMMRDLDGNSKSPNSLKNQARVHCVHCTTSKTQGYIHNGWHFLPWHRAEIYYFEQSMQYLLQDPTFAMPYWEWDNPAGTWLLPQYLDSKSALWDSKRTQNQSAGISLMKRYNSPEETYKAMTGINDPYLFHGLNDPTVSSYGNQGTLEILHGWPHSAVGAQAQFQPGLDPELFPESGTCATCRFHDMGSFTTSGWDPAFWSHHYNIDRLWEEWLKQPNPNTTSGVNENFDEPAWLESTYTFYRADGVMETIQVKDVLDTKNLGYVYSPALNSWNATNSVKSGVAGRVAAAAAAAAPAGARKLLQSAELPPALTVDELLAQYPEKEYTYGELTPKLEAPVHIGRGISHWRIKRTPTTIVGAQEILIFSNISARMDERSIIEVWINKPNVTIKDKLSWHYAGALTQIPMSPNSNNVLSTQLYSTAKNRPLQINTDLYNLGLLKATELLITLVPVEYFVDEQNNAFRAAPQFSTISLGGAEIHQGTLKSYFQK
ncbi:hypothetical protein KFL_000680010 [Klebsormidium nitens]|uniref:Tyrosinase copper-binding domain-containing protein n=1 Tax=Klebsormidium nitens TaxID=105231 RepID=A0A0U9HU61_KLENI|nr:hypothetical protein KFL_000680010 [Klebsormidium nitens]|eukprot:GAQ80985.1 hypothetical protein KFL_000680010 [Klebsormidium nitens]